MGVRALVPVRWLALTATVLSPACAARNYLDPVAPTARIDRPAPSLPAPRSLRIVTFNVKHGKRVDGAIGALKTHPDLRDADILLLQEMTGAGVEAIARALSVEAAYYPASNHQGRDNGNAVLSRWPIMSSWKVPLPHAARTTGEARAAVGVRLLVGDRLFLAYSVHISSPFALTPTQRNDQVAAVLADAAASAEPAVIGGDFNGWRIGRQLEGAGYAWVTRDVGPSLVSFSVDHIFTRGLPSSDGSPWAEAPALGPLPGSPGAGAPGGRGAGARAGVARDVLGVSDHRPVWAVLSLGPCAPGPERSSRLRTWPGGRCEKLTIRDLTPCPDPLSPGRRPCPHAGS